MLRYLVLSLCVLGSVDPAAGQNAPTPADARMALERAGTYFRDHLGVDGTYVWQYSLDGRVRRGEGGEVPASLGWIQPPGTPAVGAAFLRIHEVTGDRQWLDAAHEVATALVETQLLSGGWSYAIETNPEKAESWCYRASGIGKKECERIKDEPRPNRTILDDNRTQSVLNFLMWFDKAGDGTDSAVRQSIKVALERLMDVQYRNGAVPAAFAEAAPGAGQEISGQASIPATWPQEWQKPDSPPYFITNDHVQRDTGRMFLNAFDTYGKPAYLRTAMEIGDFLVDAQLPHPQQGWAQIYDRSLQPVWGRKFEPPAVTSRETAGSIDYLLDLYDWTGKVQYLEAAQAAGQWLEEAQLPDGSWARFYELNTNRPLYVDNDYKLTFNDQNLLDHYGMKAVSNIKPVLDRLGLDETGQDVSRADFWINAADGLSYDQLEPEAHRLIESQDSEGRWIDGDWIDGQEFIDNVFILARYIELAPPEAN